MLRFRWTEWHKLDSVARKQIADEAKSYFAEAEKRSHGQSAIFSMVGHKGDLLLVHFRESIEQLKETELQITSLRLSEYLEAASSFLSVVELGLYESSVKLFRSLSDRGIEPHSDPWKIEVEELLKRQRDAMKARLFPEMPGTRYVCFYPMDRRRGEDKNWYTLPSDERQRQLDDYGKNARR